MDEVVEGVSKLVVEEKYSAAPVSVWWILGNLDAYKDEYVALRIKDNIYSALAATKCNGPVSIYCFGDTTLVPYFFWTSLYVTGIEINHFPTGYKDTIYKNIIVDMMLWAKDNPAPANYLLMLGDAPISYVIQLLQKRGYNILITQTPDLSEPPLLEAAVAKSVLAGGPPLSKGESQQQGETLQAATGGLDSEVHAGNSKGKFITVGTRRGILLKETDI